MGGAELAAVVLIVLGAVMIAVRIVSTARAEARSERIERRIDGIEREIVEAREECERKARESCARINVLERRVGQIEAPDPIDLLMDEED